MIRKSGFLKLLCMFLLVAIVATLIVFHPVNPPKTRAQAFAVAMGTIAIANFAFNRIEAHTHGEELEKIQDLLEEQTRMLKQIEKQLDALKNETDTLARNLEIDTKEIESYIQDIGAQAGIDSIKTHYGELQDNARNDVTQMSYAEVQALQQEIDKWSDNVLGSWDIKNAVTRINSAVCPDTPHEGVLELWTDQALLKMPGPSSAANDFSLKVESTTPSGANGAGAGGVLPVLVERPTYFDFNGKNGGNIGMGVSEPREKWYFSEGTTRPGYEPYLCISNPEGSTASLEVSFMLEDGSVAKQFFDVPARSRHTVVVRDILGEGDDQVHDFSTVVESKNAAPVVAEMPQYHDSWVGGDVITGANSPAVVSYLAEGTCRPEFETYVTLQNPGNTDTTAVLTYMRGDGTTEEQSVDVPAHSRQTVRPSDVLGAGDDAAHDFSTRVESTGNVPIVVQRPVYFNYKGEWEGGHCAAAVQEPSDTLFLAEGTCRPEFETYVTLQNPGNTDTTALLTYMTGDGTTTEQSVDVPAHSRQTVRPSDVLGAGDDAAHDFSTRIESSGGVPLVAERPMYHRYKGELEGGHCGVAANEPSGVHHLAEGTVRPGFDPYITIQNPNDEAVDVNLTYMWSGGGVTTEERSLPANSRDTVRVNESPAAKTLTSYYNSLKSYFQTLIEYQEKGLILVAEAYNQRYLGKSDTPPSQQTLNYLHGSFKRLIQAELDEFLTCVESLVASWSYDYTPNGLASEASNIFADADSIYMQLNNSLLQGRTGDGKNFYGAFGRAFMNSDDRLSDGVTDFWMTGTDTLAADASSAGQTWRDLRLKYYDPGQEKLLEDNSVGVARFHQNCEPGAYKAGVRSGAIMSGGESPTLGSHTSFQISTKQNSFGLGDAPDLPFGSFHFFCQPRTGYLSQAGGESIRDKQMEAYLRIYPEACLDMEGGDQLTAYLKPGDTLGCGSIQGWRSDGQKQTDLPAGDDYFRVSVGGGHGIALESDGSLAGWGSNEHGQADCPTGDDYVQAAAGGFHSLALKSDGSLAGWGFNGNGQTNCPAGSDHVHVAAGHLHSLALKSDGSLVGWGCNSTGQTNCPAGNDFVQVASGDNHGLALKSDGSIVGWGSNAHGQIDCPTGNEFVGIAAGGDHSTAMKSDGSAVSWGNGDHGQLAVPGGKDKLAVAAGKASSLCTEMKRYSLECWGWSPAFAGYSQEKQFIQVDPIDAAVLALKSDGSLAGWGLKEYGQIDYPGGNDYVQVAGGSRFGLALKRDGSIVGWGYNNKGQIDCPAGNDYVQVSAGEHHSLALKSDGSIVGWGWNIYGQADCPPGNDFVQIAAGGGHSLALRSDGSILGWGDNHYGQAAPPPGNDFIQVAAGAEYGLALKSDGSIVGWGANGYGQINCPGGNGFIQVAAGFCHSLALKSDGSAVGWGWNRFGQAHCPSGNNFVAVAGQSQSSVVMKIDDNLQPWAPWTWR